METLVINIPEQKTALVKKLLKELGVTFQVKSKKSKIPNALTAKTIEELADIWSFTLYNMQ